MKVHVLYDDTGKVGVMSHPDHGVKKASGGQGGFKPGPGQHTAYLELPASFAPEAARAARGGARGTSRGNAAPRRQEQVTEGACMGPRL
jgi:hypothetical protein